MPIGSMLMLVGRTSHVAVAKLKASEAFVAFNGSRFGLFSHKTQCIIPYTPKSKPTMMRRSREYGSIHLQGSANASWGNPLSPCLAPNDLSTSSTKPGSANASWGKPLSPCLAPNDPSTSSTKPSLCVDPLLLHQRRDRRQPLDESLKRERRPTPQKKTLVDASKMDRLLHLLRTNEFVGTIDPKHHSHYLSEEPLQASAKKSAANALMTRRSFAYVSTKRDSSHFKAALKKVKSASAVAAA
jgi:hypothetical protein